MLPSVRFMLVALLIALPGSPNAFAEPFPQTNYRNPEADFFSPHERTLPDDILFELDELESWIEECPEEMLRDYASEPSKEDLQKIKDALSKFATDQNALDSGGNVDPSKLGEAAIKTYDKNNDGALSSEELKQFLKDYCVGNYFTRGSWADGLVDFGDTNGDKKLSAKEIVSAFEKSTR